MRHFLHHFYRICLLLALLAATSHLRSQPPNEAVFLFPLRQLLGDRYETVEEADFQKQFFRVRKNGLYGLIDRQGKEVSAPQYEQMGYFGLSLMAVRKGKKWGALNRRGDLVIPIEYDEIGQNNGSRFVEVRKDSLWAVFNESGKMLMPFEYDRLHIEQDKVLCWLPNNPYPFWRDSAGGRFSVDSCDYIRRLFGGGWSACRAGRCAIFESDGQQLTDFTFPRRIFRIPGNRVAANHDWDDEMFLYDYQGNCLIDSSVQVVEIQGSIWISMPSMHGFLHQDGRFTEVTADIALFSGGESWSSMGENLAKTYRKIYRKWEEEWEAEYLEGWVNMHTGYAVPANFREVIFQNDKVFAYQADTSLTRRADTTFVYSNNSRLLHTLPFYARFFPHAVVGFYYQNERYGLIDTTFQPITPPQFEDLEAVDWGGFLFKRNGKQGLIDQQGKEILPPIYDNITPVELAGQWLTVTVNKKVGMVNLQGKQILPIEYYGILPIEGQPGTYRTFKNGETAIFKH